MYQVFPHRVLSLFCFCLLALASFPLAAENAQPKIQAIDEPIRGLNAKRTLLNGISASPNEYVSYAIYYWPDPANPAGPWKSIDGKKNQELISQGDANNLSMMIKTVQSLAASYQKTKKAQYANRAGEWIRHWFISPSSRIMPHLKYSQVYPGAGKEGSGGGIIDMANLPSLLKALGQLKKSPALSSNEWKTFNQWIANYGIWLKSSPQGRHEWKTRNNHFTYYMAQRAAIANWLGESRQARKIIQEAFTRFDEHISPDGQQPMETNRATALAYSIYGLGAWFILAEEAEKSGIDYWNYKSPAGASLLQALNYVEKLAETEKDNPSQRKLQNMRKQLESKRK